MYKIIVRRKVLRRIQKLPESVQRRVANLVEDLRDKDRLEAIGLIIANLERSIPLPPFPRLGGLLVLRENFKNH